MKPEIRLGVRCSVRVLALEMNLALELELVVGK